MKSIVMTLLIASVSVFDTKVEAQITFDSKSKEQMVLTNFSSLPLAFTENQGQFGDRVIFKADAGGATFYFFPDEVAYLFVRDTDELVEEDFIPFAEMVNLPDEYLHSRYKKEALLIKAKFIGANPDAEAIGVDRLPHNNNYFIGNNPAKWRTDVPNYSAIVYNDIYAGIDLKYYGDGRAMKYDFIVQPGADISQIKIRYEGVEGLSVTPAGKLQVQTSFGLVNEETPHIYQEIGGIKQELSGRYEVVKPNVFGFALDEDYDTSYPLIIDPTLSYSTYLGGSLEDWGYSIAVDLSLCAYVTGRTWSPDFDTAAPLPYEPYQDSINGNCDVFITKLDPLGFSLVYSTYLGGSADDWGYGIAVDNSGCAYVAGRTKSTDFDTVNAYQEFNQGDFDGFVVKLSGNGNFLDYSTYLGGSSYDACHAIALDGSGCAYVTGMTYSDDFDTTANPYQGNNDGYWDVFVTKFNDQGNAPIYSTYLGGSYIETGYGIAVDGSGNAYVTGWTWSDDFDTTANAYQDSLEGQQDVFVTKLSSNGGQLEYSTYLGGSDKDYGKSIAVDGSNCAYVTGWTWSNDFDTTANAYQGSLEGPQDVFVTKFSDLGDTLYSTYLGGTDEDCGYGIAVDFLGCAYVTGRTKSIDFDTAWTYQERNNGEWDAYVTMFFPSGDSLFYSTYLGGENDDWAYGIALDPLTPLDGYVTGKTGSPDFPTTAFSYERNYQGNYDAFVAKFMTGYNQPPIAFIDYIVPDTQLAGDPVDFGGHGFDPEGFVVFGWRWRSDIYGPLSDTAFFTTTDLSVGTHTIYFKVQDDVGAWSEDVSDTVVITTSDPPTAVIDSIRPSPADFGDTVTFGGHGGDNAYSWRSDINSHLSDLASFSTSDLSIGTHTIYFKVQNNNGAWSEDVSETLDVSSEKWQISWWYPSFGDYFDLLMHDSYSCTLLATNISQTDQIFNFGLDMERDSLHWLNELWLRDPDWVLEIDTTCLLNGQSYTFGQDTTDIIAADETKEYVFKISNDWNWVEEWSFERILPIVISFMSGILPPGVSEIYGLYENLNTVDDFLKSPLLIEYNYPAMDDADSAVLSETYNVWVRPEKIFFYWMSFWYGKIASDYTTVGYAFLFSVPPLAGPAIATAFFAMEAVIFACSEKLYLAAVDPDRNYQAYVDPRRPEDIEGYDVVVDSVEEGCGRYIDYKAFELLSISEACYSSYAKCVGALKDGSTEWAAKQLTATYCYTKHQASLMQELSSMSHTFIDNIDPPDNAVIDSIEESLHSDSLPDIEAMIMGSLMPDFDEDMEYALAQICSTAYAGDSGNICSNFVNLPQNLAYLDTTLQKIIACSLFVNTLEGVLIGDVVLIEPEIVIPSENPTCTVWVEFPEHVLPIPPDYQFDTVLVNDENPVTIDPFFIRDNDGDGVEEIGMVFPPYTTGEGKILQSFFGDVIKLAGDTVLPDTILFSAAALLTVYHYTITSGLCGQVRESDNFGPLESVFVELYDSLDMLVCTTDTDDEGKFDFPLDSAGTYSAEFSRIGYHDTTLSGLEVAPNETTCVCLVMQASPGCPYTPGDANGDGNVMGNDVTYSVRYFKGLGDAPPDSCPYEDGWLYSGGDANGNCQFTGSDVTFLVAYFKGVQPEILWCPDTPPAEPPVLGIHRGVTPVVLPKK